MNESEFENQLRALRPLAPPATLENTIAEQLASTPSPVDPEARGADSIPCAWSIQRILSSLGWAFGGAVVASIALISFYESRQPTPPSSGPGRDAHPADQEAFLPMESSRELVGAQDGGLTYDEEHTPTEVLRYSSVERHAWANPTTGARVEVEVPREDLVLVPVSFQ